MKTAVGLLLASISRLRELRETLVNAAEAEKDTNAKAFVALADIEESSQRTDLLNGIACTARQRHLARRMAVAAQVENIRDALPGLVGKAQFELSAIARDIRQDDSFIVMTGDVFDKPVKIEPAKSEPKVKKRLPRTGMVDFDPTLPEAS